MKRFFVKKSNGFKSQSLELLQELRSVLKEDEISDLEVYNVYDIFDANSEELDILKNRILSDPVCDEVFEDISLDDKIFLCIELLPAQYNQREDWIKQCFLLFSQTEIKVKCSELIVFDGKVKNFSKLKEYLINPIEKREKDLFSLEEFKINTEDKIEIIENFINLNDEGLNKVLSTYSLAMNLENLKYIQDYFKNIEKRDPSLTEIMVFDTYWSDHCRHTTFNTNLKNIEFGSTILDNEIKNSYEKFLNLKREINDKKPLTLMSMATICAKYFMKNSILDNLEISDEINACSIEVDVDEDGKMQKWLLMFKNETHNHPTEIEPFGGASTCIGGAIRDPLSGRSYVYQAMRISGAADITEDINKTLSSKLPQRTISKQAALGYSSYGNQIGLATTFVKEIYDDSYKAKRMEVGVVVGGARKENVIRQCPKDGDVVLLIGGRTGKDGIGGAVGSSKKHDDSSLFECATQVQKGNPIIQRKIQRLFRNKEVSKLIKRSNDFGAGGVCVAVGELARSLNINLNSLKTKYEGLTPTQLAISESQERMAVVCDPNDVEKFLKFAKDENLECYEIAKVGNNDRLIMKYNNKDVVNISKSFLDSNGILPTQNVKICDFSAKNPFNKAKTLTKDEILNFLSDLNICSQRGMVEMFDSSIGRSSVLMPYGGKYQLSQTQTSVQKLPVDGFTNTSSVLSFGFDPKIFHYSPYLGAQYAVIQSLAKLVASGANYEKARLSFQEYFEKLENNDEKWGKVFLALLGALEAQLAFCTPAIGGKDSMSGSYNELNVVPTLISFAITTQDARKIISPEFKKPDSKIYLLKAKRIKNDMPNYEQIKHNFKFLQKLNDEGKIQSCFSIESGGIIEAIFKMSFGNKIGASIQTDENLFDIGIGDFIIETNEDLKEAILLGYTNSSKIVSINSIQIDIDEALEFNEKTLKGIYPYHKNSNTKNMGEFFDAKKEFKSKKSYEKVKALIAVFPGSNCEYDSKKAFEKAGAEAEIFVFNNLNQECIKDSIDKLALKIKKCQIFMIPGGFSASDEPDGSAKFIVNVLKNEKIKQAIKEHLENDGLILGICNGFQALIKSGLLPYSKIIDLPKNSPTLFRNSINRHISKMAYTKITSNNSAWLSSFKSPCVHCVALSHSEGRIVIDENLAKELFENGQIAAQYCDFNGVVSDEFNHNGSCYAIEAMVSKCGKILGKMGHSERYEDGLFKNIYGDKMQNIFENGVNYFKK